MRIKVLIITMFQSGEPGVPGNHGEASTWIERRSLRTQIPIPGTTHGLFVDPKKEIALLVTEEQVCSWKSRRLGYINGPEGFGRHGKGAME